MGECIICGAEVAGADICSFHEEDVLFSFTGDRPDQLVEGRFYEGTVDGFADFGVFVDLGNGVTGLLHRNQLDRRLESLGWSEGDTVYVQVTSIDPSGEVDLAQSIRQSPEEFRGALEQGPDDGPAAEPTTTGGPTERAISGRPSPPRREIDRVQIRSIDRYFGREVLLEGIVQEVRQTGGPTVMILHDESGTVECAAFAGAGVRAYPTVEAGDAIRVRGKVEYRFDDYQIEVATLDRLEGEAARTVRDRVADGDQLPDSIDELPLLYDDAANAAIEIELREAAAAIRRAVHRRRPIRIRHPVTVDGFVAAAALERAIETVVADRDPSADARAAVRRRPVRSSQYAIAEAIEDTVQLSNATGEAPFVVLVGLGSDERAVAAFDLLDTYEIDYYVLDTANPTPTILDRVDPLVNPWCGEGTFPIPTTTATTINVAGLIAEGVRDDLRHLPAVTSPDAPADTAVALLEASPYDAADVEAMREAIALEAYHQPWADKRALVRSLLFEHEAGAVEPISEQSREKLDLALATAAHNVEVATVNGKAVVLLDVDAFGNRFEFPPEHVLLRGLRRDPEIDATVAVGIGRDHLAVSSDVEIALGEVAQALEAAVPHGAIILEPGAAGAIRFLPGCRDAVTDAALEAVTNALAG